MEVFRNFLKNHIGIFFSVIITAVLFILIYSFIIPRNIDNLGGTHSWLSGSTIKFVNYWLEEGAANLNFTNYENPRSIEFSSLEDRRPYLSYPTGETFFVYVAARAAGKNEISISFLHKFQLAMFLISSVLLACFIYLFIKRTIGLKSEKKRVAISVLSAVFWMLTPSCAYYLANVYFADQCVILWVMAFILVEYIFLTSKKKEVLLLTIRSMLLCTGILIDYYFWVLAFLVFLAEIIMVFASNKKGARKAKVWKIVLWFSLPIIFALLIFFFQISRTNGFMNYMIDKYNLRVVGNNTLVGTFKTILTHFVKGFLSGGSAKYYFTAVIFSIIGCGVYFVKKKGLRSIVKNPGIMLLLANYLAIILQIIIFKQHSEIHEFSMNKVGWAVALLPVVMALVYKNVLDKKRSLSFFWVYIVSLFLMMALVGVPNSAIAFVKNHISVSDYTLALLLKENTKYEDVVFSFTEEIPANPPQQLAKSKKRIYKVSSSNMIGEKLSSIGENAIGVLVVNKEKRTENNKSQECLVKNGSVRIETERYLIVDLKSINKCKEIK